MTGWIRNRNGVKGGQLEEFTYPHQYLSLELANKLIKIFDKWSVEFMFLILETAERDQYNATYIDNVDQNIGIGLLQEIRLAPNWQIGFDSLIVEQYEAIKFLGEGATPRGYIARKLDQPNAVLCYCRL